MKSTIRIGLLAAICALGAFASSANANDRDQFRQRVYERARENTNHHSRDHARRDDRRDYSHDRARHDYGNRHDYGHRRDNDYRRHDSYRRDSYRRDYNRGHDHRRHVDSYRQFSYYDRFDRRFHPSLKRGFYCDDFGHFRGRHYHVSRSDFYSSFYPRFPYRPYSDRGGRATVIVSIPF